MKRLTIEQKAKAYDEAFEKAKRMLSEKELYYLFPEFEEIYNEQIKKEIIDYLEKKVNENTDITPLTLSTAKEHVKLCAWIYWLKKSCNYGLRKEI